MSRLLIATIQIVQNSWLTYLSGGLMLLAGVASIMVALSAKKRLNSLHEALIRGRDPTDAQELERAFKAAVPDGEEGLSPVALAELAASLGEKSFTKNELAATFSLLDQNLDGQIDHAEFARWWNGDKTVDYSIL